MGLPSGMVERIEAQASHLAEELCSVEWSAEEWKTVSGAMVLLRNAATVLADLRVSRKEPE